MIAEEVKEEDEFFARERGEPPGRCAFCDQTRNAKGNQLLRAGKFYKFGKYFFHYFCVLFSRDGEQKGKDSEGLNGFFLEDIVKV